MLAPKFCIALIRPCNTAAFCRLDGKHVVFGQVIDGIEVVKAIESVGSRTGETAYPVVISACGELPQASTGAQLPATTRLSD